MRPPTAHGTPEKVVEVSYSSSFNRWYSEHSASCPELLFKENGKPIRHEAFTDEQWQDIIGCIYQIEVDSSMWGDLQKKTAALMPMIKKKIPDSVKNWHHQPTPESSRRKVLIRVDKGSGDVSKDWGTYCPTDDRSYPNLTDDDHRKAIVRVDKDHPVNVVLAEVVQMLQGVMLEFGVPAKEVEEYGHVSLQDGRGPGGSHHDESGKCPDCPEHEGTAGDGPLKNVLSFVLAGIQALTRHQLYRQGDTKLETPLVEFMVRSKPGTITLISGTVRAGEHEIVTCDEKRNRTLLLIRCGFMTKEEIHKLWNMWWPTFKKGKEQEAIRRGDEQLLDEDKTTTKASPVQTHTHINP